MNELTIAQASATPKSERRESSAPKTVQKTASVPPPPAEGGVEFASLGLFPALLRGVQAAGYSTATPIQEQAIPPALAGHDVVGCAQTGTGKTAAFVLPMLQRMLKTPAVMQQDVRGAVPPREEPRGGISSRPVRALILAPTRELAAQIGESITAYGKDTPIRHTVIFGGVSQQRQVQDLRRGVDIIVATPGRLWDLLQQRLARVDAIETLVLDEFDRMLDQGFLPDIKRILSCTPRARQTLLFSATMPKELESIVKQIVREPVRVAVAAIASTPEKVDQSVWHVDQQGKRSVLETLLRSSEIERAIVFTRTKHGANRVAEHLNRAGVDADAIHGNKSQNARERALSRFRDGDLRVLVATDLAARGIDVDGISHVINYDMPVDPESYVHRIGRTARAGRTGKAVSLCTPDERPTLTRIERLIAQTLPVAGRSAATQSSHAEPAAPRSQPQHARSPQHSRAPHSRQQAPRGEAPPTVTQASPQKRLDPSRGRGPNRPYPR